jgi:hypothetical protein
MATTKGNPTQPLQVAIASVVVYDPGTGQEHYIRQGDKVSGDHPAVAIHGAKFFRPALETD